MKQGGLFAGPVAIQGSLALDNSGAITESSDRAREGSIAAREAVKASIERAREAVAAARGTPWEFKFTKAVLTLEAAMHAIDQARALLTKG